ncbi:periostin [Trichonephila inaurata madagascariensis]|uniref:Periostin n=1 Tax=Trichonephila inaurata madagascariensis TaxID=2747483 RepID=A0A8X6WMT2_9ARAC|nr:periostin [Trichonephila inaurata madagascariensis]
MFFCLMQYFLEDKEFSGPANLKMKISQVPILVLLLFTCVTASDPWWKKIAQKQGPMVCAGKGKMEPMGKFLHPFFLEGLCGSETVVRFSCCPGYERTEGERGCSLVKPLKNLAETAQEIGASQFIKQTDQSGILPLLTSRGAYTVFVALDKAFESLTKEQEKALNASKKSRSRPSVLLYTIVEGRITAEELPKSLHTLYREGSATVTKYPNGLIAINCIPVVATNIEATNGIIHVTESLLLSTVLLRYHIVDTVWCSSVTAGATELKTLEGSILQLSCNTSGQYVDEARIIEKDFTARNGFVHHIDTVMIPNRGKLF